jgi:hypothetical protein
MENDSIRPSGSNTLVDIWVNGKLRAISVTRQAIDGFVGTNSSTSMSDEERCEFVRTHLPLVVTAVKTQLREANGDPESVTVDVGQLGGRVADRRKGDRRKVKLPKESLAHDDRRRGDRRKSDRRSR